MLNRLKTFLQDRRIKRQLKAVLHLLYSDKKFETDELINALNPKDDIEKLEYYIIIEIAAKLERPFTENDITKIYEEQVKALESYVASKELRENIKQLTKVKADLSMLHFNVFMDRLRRAYELNKYSPGGMLLSDLLAKKGPLTVEEEEQVDKEYKEIKRLEDDYNQKLKDLEKLANKE